MRRRRKVKTTYYRITTRPLAANEIMPKQHARRMLRILALTVAWVVAITAAIIIGCCWLIAHAAKQKG